MNQKALLTDLIPGAVLIYTGIMHLAQPFLFASHLRAYHVCPELALPAITFLVPALHVITGACLLLGTSLREVRAIGMLLFAAFALIQGKVLISGERISCGCFGFQSGEVSLWTLAIPITLLVLLITSTIRSFRPVPAVVA